MADIEGLREFAICAAKGAIAAVKPEVCIPKTVRLDRDRLLHAAVPIQEISAIRKHLSALKGGRLAALAHPARVVSLILSDVPGDRLDTIASGPTAPDPTTYRDAARIAKRAGI